MAAASVAQRARTHGGVRKPAPVGSRTPVWTSGRGAAACSTKRGALGLAGKGFLLCCSPQCTLLPVSSLSAASAAPRSGRRLAPSQCGPSAASRQHFQPPPPLSARGGALGSQPPSPSCSSVGDGSAVCGMSARAEAGLMPFECSAPIASTISPLIPMRADHCGRRWS